MSCRANAYNREKCKAISFNLKFPFLTYLFLYYENMEDDIVKRFRELKPNMPHQTKMEM